MKNWKCDHDAKLFATHVCPPDKELGIPQPYVLRAYVCRWHKSAANRLLKSLGKRLIAYKPEVSDEELIKQEFLRKH